MIMLIKNSIYYIYTRKSIDSYYIECKPLIFDHYINSKYGIFKTLSKNSEVKMHVYLNIIYDNKLILKDRDDDKAIKMFQEYLDDRIKYLEYSIEKLNKQKLYFTKDCIRNKT